MGHKAVGVASRDGACEVNAVNDDRSNQRRRRQTERSLTSRDLSAAAGADLFVNGRSAGRAAGRRRYEWNEWRTGGGGVGRSFSMHVQTLTFDLSALRRLSHTNTPRIQYDPTGPTNRQLSTNTCRILHSFKLGEIVVSVFKCSCKRSSRIASSIRVLLGRDHM